MTAGLFRALHRAGSITAAPPRHFHPRTLRRQLGCLAIMVAVAAVFAGYVWVRG